MNTPDETTTEEKFLKAFLTELGANRISTIEHDGLLWSVHYKNGLPVDVFESFDDLYEWLTTEGND